MGDGKKTIGLVRSNRGSGSLTRLLGQSLDEFGVRPARIRHRTREYMPAITGIALSRDENRLYVSTRAGTIRVIDVDSLSCTRGFPILAIIMVLMINSYMLICKHA